MEPNLARPSASRSIAQRERTPTSDPPTSLHRIVRCERRSPGYRNGRRSGVHDDQRGRWNYPSRDEVIATCDVDPAARGPTLADVEQLRDGQILWNGLSHFVQGSGVRPSWPSTSD